MSGIVTSVASLSDLTRDWFQSDRATGAEQPYVNIDIPSEECTARQNLDFYGWRLNVSFGELHGSAFHITRYIVRWFDADGRVTETWLFTTKEDIRTFLGMDTIPANGKTAALLSMQASQPDAGSVSGIGITLAGTDNAGNLFEFRAWRDLAR